MARVHDDMGNAYLAIAKNERSLTEPKPFHLFDAAGPAVAVPLAAGKLPRWSALSGSAGCPL
ncbi:hypothetical protein BH23GEM1_BH23GEM1_11250 [soil metagenome]